MTTIAFKPVDSPAAIATVAALADTIWRAHYPNIITVAQIDYMLSRFQSADAIAQQIRDGLDYSLIDTDGKPIGYFATRFDADALYVSKVYLLHAYHGRGIGYQAAQEIERRAQAAGRSKLWLTVNKDNRVAIRAYERWGYQHRGPVVTDIGAGFVMDDYRLEKILSPQYLFK